MVEREDRALAPDTESATRLPPAQSATLREAQHLVPRFVGHCNRVRLHGALGYIAPLAFMAGGRIALVDGQP